MSNIIDIRRAVFKEQDSWTDLASLPDHALIHLISDNYDILCHPRQYAELVLTMSTGDFACHIAAHIEDDATIRTLIECGVEFYKEDLN